MSGNEEPVVIEFAKQIEKSMDSREGAMKVTGRLILADDGLYFICGAISNVNSGYLQSGAAVGGLVGMVAGAAMDAAADRSNSMAAADLHKRVAEVKNLPPAEQVLQIPGSLFIPKGDLHKVKLTFFGAVKVTTDARGDKHTFEVPGGHRKKIKKWIKALK